MSESISTAEIHLVPILNIVGEKVALGPFTREMVPLLTRWVNDFEVAFHSGDPLRPTNVDVERARYEQATTERSPRRVRFAIIERATMRPIGVTDWRDIHSANRTAEFGILIGVKECWSKGYGTETTRLMLEYAFTVLNLHSVVLKTSSFNERALRAYQRAGFHEVGRWRASQRFGGRLYDEVIMDCLATEFTGHTGRILALPE
jgi:diamine N-acetyltransferase